MAIVPVPVANAFRGEDDGPAELSLSDFRRQLMMNMMGKMMMNSQMMMKNKRMGMMGMGGNDDTVPSPTPIPPPLVDDDEFADRCPGWAAEGRCIPESVNYSGFMLRNCQKSCALAGSNFPTLSPALQDVRDCVRWAERGDCTTNPKYMWPECGDQCRDTGITRGPVDPPTDDPATNDDPTPTPFYHAENCEDWAVSGECLKNDKYMWEFCEDECLAQGITRGPVDPPTDDPATGTVDDGDTTPQ